MAPGTSSVAPARFWIETLGCPKNAVDSDKVAGSLLADGLVPAPDLEHAELVVVNTCAFVEDARRESIETILELAQRRVPGARLVVTGCLAERAGDDLARALPEVDAVVGFEEEAAIAPVAFRRAPRGVRDLLELPRAAPARPWAYVKVAEGCDRTCSFCAIPSFRGRQRSRSPGAVVDEARGLVAQGVRELVLVAQDLASYGRDVSEAGALAPLLTRLDALSGDGLERIRLLYLYPSEVRDPLVTTMLTTDTVVPYFDLSLQHAAKPLLRRMRRPGDGERFRALVERLRRDAPEAAFRSSFLVGFPGETEADHEELLGFLADVGLDWAGFFAFSSEDGTDAADLDGTVAPELTAERLRECSEIQDPITARARDHLVGLDVGVLVDEADGDRAVGRTHREAPEIDGVVSLRGPAAVGETVVATVEEARGTDVVARRVDVPELVV